MKKEKILSKDQIKYLTNAFNRMYYEITEDIKTLSNDPNATTELWIWNYLPPVGRGDLDVNLAFKLLTTLIALSFKFCYQRKFLLANRAEEIMLYIATKIALELSEKDNAVTEDYTDFMDTYYEDWDFFFLYKPEYDGIDEGRVGKEIGMISLAVKNWFKPYNISSNPHPFFIDKKDRIVFPANIVEYDENELKEYENNNDIEEENDLF